MPQIHALKSKACCRIDRITFAMRPRKEKITQPIEKCLPNISYVKNGMFKKYKGTLILPNAINVESLSFESADIDYLRLGVFKLPFLENCNIERIHLNNVSRKENISKKWFKTHEFREFENGVKILEKKL